MSVGAAVVGFVVFTMIGPFVGGYLGGWLIDRSGNDPVVALLQGGSSTAAIAAAIGAALGLALSLRFTAGAVLDSMVDAFPDGLSSTASPRRDLFWIASRRQDPDAGAEERDDPVGLGAAAGWVGSGVAALLFLGLSLAAFPGPDRTALEHIAGGVAGTPDWVSAAFPTVARTIVSAVLGILAGAIWSTFAGPAARIEAIEEETRDRLS